MSKAPPAADQIGTGTGPDGRRVIFYEADRPGTLSHRGGAGVLYLACDAETGEKITHSDSVAGLLSSGFKADKAGAEPAPTIDPDPVGPAPVLSPVSAEAEPAPEPAPEPQEEAPRKPRGRRFGE